LFSIQTTSLGDSMQLQEAEKILAAKSSKDASDIEKSQQETVKKLSGAIDAVFKKFPFFEENYKFGDPIWAMAKHDLYSQCQRIAEFDILGYPFLLIVYAKNHSDDTGFLIRLKDNEQWRLDGHSYTNDLYIGANDYAVVNLATKIVKIADHIKMIRGKYLERMLALEEGKDEFPYLSYRSCPFLSDEEKQRCSEFMDARKKRKEEIRAERDAKNEEIRKQREVEEKFRNEIYTRNVAFAKWVGEKLTKEHFSPISMWLVRYIPKNLESLMEYCDEKEEPEEFDVRDAVFSFWTTKREPSLDGTFDKTTFSPYTVRPFVVEGTILDKEFVKLADPEDSKNPLFSIAFHSRSMRINNDHWAHYRVPYFKTISNLTDKEVAALRVEWDSLQNS